MLWEMVNAGGQDGFILFIDNTIGWLLKGIADYTPWWMQGWGGWLFWVILIKVFIKVEHPPVPDETPLDKRRMIVGWIALAILVLTFSFRGIYNVMPEGYGYESIPNSPEQVQGEGVEI